MIEIEEENTEKINILNTRTKRNYTKNASKSPISNKIDKKEQKSNKKLKQSAQELGWQPVADKSKGDRLSERFHFPEIESGPTLKPEGFKDAIEYFYQILDPQLIKDIAKFSQNRANKLNNKENNYEITYETMKAFIGCIMMMGESKLPEEKDHWATEGNVLSKVRYVLSREH